MNRTAAALLITALLAPTLLAQEQPLTVSPGNDDSVATVEARCPTFSWGTRRAPESWRLAVYRVVDGSSAGPEPGALVLSKRLPGVVRSWTPSLARCLEPGRTFAWSVGAVSRRGKIAWSDARIFRVAERAPVEGEEALASFDPRSTLSTSEASTADSRRQTADVRETSRAAAGDGIGGSMSSALAPRAPLAGAALDMDGHLRLATSAPKIRLDDPAQTWDLVATSLGFFVANATSGGTQLSIFNSAPTGALELKDTGLTIKNDLICTDCIHDGDLAPDSVGAGAVSAEAIGGEETAAVYSVKVECEGECSDGTPNDACQALTGIGVSAQPIGLSCSDVEDELGGVACGGDNKCSLITPFSAGVALSAYCEDVSGWDAIVFCLADGSG